MNRYFNHGNEIVVLQYRCSDALGHRLNEIDGLTFHNVANICKDIRIIDGSRQLIAPAGLLQLQI